MSSVFNIGRIIFGYGRDIPDSTFRDLDLDVIDYIKDMKISKFLINWSGTVLYTRKIDGLDYYVEFGKFVSKGKTVTSITSSCLGNGKVKGAYHKVYLDDIGLLRILTYGREDLI